MKIKDIAFRLELLVLHDIPIRLGIGFLKFLYCVQWVIALGAIGLFIDLAVSVYIAALFVFVLVAILGIASEGLQNGEWHLVLYFITFVAAYTSIFRWFCFDKQIWQDKINAFLEPGSETEDKNNRRSI